VREETDSIAEAGIAQTFFTQNWYCQKKKKKKDGFCQNLKSLAGGSNIHTASAFSLCSVAMLQIP
jgi:hypothetical protein